MNAGSATVTGNYIGVGSDGTTALGNSTFGMFVGGDEVTIGGTGAGAGNVIRHNGSAGVAISSIGQGNAIVGNSISANGQLGIDLGIDGVTANDAQDPDPGANNLQNYPVLISAVPNGSGGTLVEYSLNSNPSSKFQLEFFTNEACDGVGPSGRGEGLTSLGTTNTVMTDASGDHSGTFDSGSTPVVEVGEVITSAATRLDSTTDAPIETSEFSECETVVPETFTVNSTNDPGTGTCDSTECTLREAIAAAEAAPGRNTVAFSISGDGPHTIALSGGTGTLEVINDPISIDGTTEPSFDPNTDVPIVVLDGENISGHGLELEGGNSAVAGLVIQDFVGDGIRLATEDSNAVQGNYIGTDAAGTAADGNGNGIAVVSGSDSNLIGGNSPALRNVISGNIVEGVQLESGSNSLQGNYIGLGADGSTDLGNGSDGISISGNTNTIGGTTPA
ncbi:MAG: CSLREA domain-containing protein, partial [Actinomycetota bacterium]